MIFVMNRRAAFGLTFLGVFLTGVTLHTMAFGNTNYDWPEFLLLMSISFGSGFWIARRFPSTPQLL
jgi:hypothetical protein